MTRSRVTLYSFSFAHHGRYSSFHRLLHYAKSCRVIDVTPPFQGNLGAVWQRRVQTRWLRWSEWRLRTVFGRSERQCVHYLYPENSLLRGLDWKNEHGLVLSCHQPASVCRDMSAWKPQPPFIPALQQADRVVVLASHFAGEYEGLCDRKAIRIIPHGIDTEFFTPKPRPRARPQVLTIGNWMRDYDFWGEIALRLSARRPDVDWVVVALPEYLGGAGHRVEQALPGRVRVLRGLSDEQLRDLYAETTVAFLPLKDAGANNALLESMATGLPLLTTDLPATREYAGTCAEFYTPGNMEECLAKLDQLLSSEEARARLGAAARQRMVQQFAWPVIAERYAELYQEVLAG